MVNGLFKCFGKQSRLSTQDKHLNAGIAIKYFLYSHYGICNRRSRCIYFSFADIHIVAPKSHKLAGETNSWHREYD
jgi:hypothetical protein